MQIQLPQIFGNSHSDTLPRFTPFCQSEFFSHRCQPTSVFTGCVGSHMSWFRRWWEDIIVEGHSGAVVGWWLWFCHVSVEEQRKGVRDGGGRRRASELPRKIFLSPHRSSLSSLAAPLESWWGNRQQTRR